MVRDVVQHLHADIVVAHIHKFAIFADSGDVSQYVFNVTVNAPSDAAQIQLSSPLPLTKVCPTVDYPAGGYEWLTGESIIAQTTEVIDGLVYIGCYAYDANDLGLGRGPKQKKYNTETCSEICWHSPFFALRENGWCVCGDRFGSPTTGKQVDTDCGTVCDGERNLVPVRLCGGIQRNAVYQNRRTERKSQIMSYIGCYVSTVEQNHDMVFGPKDSENTLESCAAACHHYRFFALQNAGFCTCGDMYASAAGYSQRDDKDCENVCSKDAPDASGSTSAVSNADADVASSTIWRNRTNDNLNNNAHAKWRCGFLELNAIYANSEYIPPDTHKFVGCYADPSEEDMPAGPKGVLQSNHALCSASCEDYRYFALRGGKKCFCGDDYGSKWEIRRVHEDKCKAACVSREGQTGLNDEPFCGNGENNAVYAVGKQPEFHQPARDLTYMGCYTDSGRNDFQLHRYNDTEYTTVDCSHKCAQYKYFALNNNGACLCGDRYATSSVTYRVVQDSDCGQPCKHETNDLFSPKRYCGGVDTNAVFRQPTDVTAKLEGTCAITLDSRRDCVVGITLEREVCEVLPGCCYDNGLGGQAGVCFRTKHVESTAPIPPNGVPEGGYCDGKLYNHCGYGLVCTNMIDDAHDVCGKPMDDDLLKAIQASAGAVVAAVTAALARGDIAAAQEAAKGAIKEDICRCTWAACAGDSNSAAEQCPSDFVCRPHEASDEICDKGTFNGATCKCYLQGSSPAQESTPVKDFFMSLSFIIPAIIIGALCLICMFIFCCRRYLRKVQRNKQLDFAFKTIVVEAAPVQTKMTTLPGYLGAPMAPVPALPMLHIPGSADEAADGSSKCVRNSSRVQSKARRKKSSVSDGKSTLSAPAKYGGRQSDISEVDHVLAQILSGHPTDDSSTKSLGNKKSKKNAFAVDSADNSMDECDVIFISDNADPRSKLVVPARSLQPPGSRSSRESSCSQLIGAEIVETKPMEAKLIVTTRLECKPSQNEVVPAVATRRRNTKSTKLSKIAPTNRTRPKRKSLARRDGRMKSGKRTRSASTEVKAAEAGADAEVNFDDELSKRKH